MSVPFKSSRLALYCWLGVLGLLGLYAPGLSSACEREMRTPAGEWREYREGDFIYQYAVSGRHALSTADHATHSDIPDIVGDVSLQLTAMRDMLQQLEFQLPLESARYRQHGVSRILIRFLELKGINGRTFDEPRRLPSGECVLVIHIATHYPSGNLTPAHEFFHLVQYGYAMLKRGWFTEGTARWSAGVVGHREGKPRPIPADWQELQEFWGRSYAAAPVWYGLIEHCDSNPARVEIPEHLASLRYHTGEPVIEDNVVPGHAFVRRVLMNLGEVSDLIAAKEGLAPYRWPQKARNNVRHDPDMWGAVVNACESPIESRRKSVSG